MEKVYSAEEFISGIFEKSVTEEGADAFHEIVARLLQITKPDDMRDFFGSFQLPVRELEEAILDAHLDKRGVEHHTKRRIMSVYEAFTLLHCNLYELLRAGEGMTARNMNAASAKAYRMIQDYIGYIENNRLPDFEDRTASPMFGTPREWMDYVEALVHLHMGHPGSYLHCFGVLINKIPRRK